MHANLNSDFQDPITDLQVYTKLISKYILRIESNSINSTIRNRLLLQSIHFRKDPFKQRHYSLPKRLPETAFYMKKSKGFFKFYILFRYPYRRQRAFQSRFNPEKKFYIQKAKRSLSTFIHTTRPSKGIPDIPVARPSKGIPDIHVI